MIQVNLIPAARLKERRIRVRVRRWIVAGAGYALFAAVAGAAALLTHGGNDVSLGGELENLRDEQVRAGDVLRDRQRDLKHANATLRANAAVGNQPDWSVLLALVAQTAGDDIVLRTCRTNANPRVAAEGAEAGSPPGAVRLALDGLGQTQSDVSQFVLRMDAVPLFRDVKLIDTKREPFFDGYAAAFRLECDLDPGGNSE